MANVWAEDSINPDTRPGSKPNAAKGRRQDPLYSAIQTSSRSTRTLNVTSTQQAYPESGTKYET